MVDFLKNKKAIIFDFDGTLADTVGIWNKVDQLSIKEFCGLDIDLEIIQFDRENFINNHNDGKVYENYVIFLIKKYKITKDVDYVINRRREIALDYIINQVDYKENADKVLKRLKQLGYKLVLATTTARRTIENYNMKNQNLIRKAKFDDIFDYIITNDEISEKKPSPQIYQKALEILKLKKEECLVVEDSIEGILSAKRAGIEVLNIPDNYAKLSQKSIDELSDYKIKNFAEFLKLL